jgi:purine-binding chemotaxis protein CheW
MDFLEIRRKAKERAARAARAAAPAPPAEPPPEPEPLPDHPAEVAPESRNDPVPWRAPARPPLPNRPPSVSPEELRAEAELGSRVAALPAAADSRFVTWRPDGGALLDLAAIEPLESERPPPPPVVEPAWALAPVAPLDDFFFDEAESAPGAGLLQLPGAAGLVAPELLEEYLIFRLAGEAYAVEIGRVLEVLRTPSITEVPRAPADVFGVISVRGEVITVVDPRGRLGLPRTDGPPARRVVIVDDGEGACGLLVDGVSGVVRLPRGGLEPCPQALGGAGGDLFLGIGRERERLFLVLDTRALLRPLRRSAAARPA